MECCDARGLLISGHDSDITECSSTPYLGITVEFLDNWVFDHGIIQANKPSTKANNKAADRLTLSSSSQKH